MTYGKKGDPIKLPGKNSPTNFYAKADEREGELQYEIFFHNEEGTTNDIV